MWLVPSFGVVDTDRMIIRTMTVRAVDARQLLHIVPISGDVSQRQHAGDDGPIPTARAADPDGTPSCPPPPVTGASIIVVIVDLMA